MKIHSHAREVINFLPKKAKILIHGAMATPQLLLEAIKENHSHFDDLEFYHLHTSGDLFYCHPPYTNRFRAINFFVGDNVRGQLDYNRVDYLPCFLSEIPYLIRHQVRPIDVVLLQVSPPNRHGHYSLGTSVDIVPAALGSAKLVLAHINPQMPFTYGDALIHESQIHHAFVADSPLPLKNPTTLTDEDLKIARHIAHLIQDQSCLQMGIGAIPDATLSQLTHHRDLGIHTEMFSDGLVDLFHSGAITNKYKKTHPGKIVTSFVSGSKKIIDFINENPLVHFAPSDYVNHPEVIARNKKVVAINSALAIDLTGQICADTLGPYQYSGVGGQMDFIRGASMSKGGLPIIAMKSVTNKGESKIVTQLLPGSAVVTTRAHTHYVVTEWGVANLYGKTLGERAQALIEIAHPNHRQQLAQSWQQQLSQNKFFKRACS
jgi:4-hydroxybutyrate CoA-transferase